MNKFKKFLNYFSIFELNLYQKSYRSPLIRMFASLAVMLVICLIRLNISIDNVVINIVSLLFIVFIMIMAILCFFIAAVECLQVGHNKKIQKERDKIFSDRSNDE
jgi:hypothetical protein